MRDTGDLVLLDDAWFEDIHPFARESDQDIDTSVPAVSCRLCGAGYGICSYHAHRFYLTEKKRQIKARVAERWSAWKK